MFCLLHNFLNLQLKNSNWEVREPRIYLKLVIIVHFHDLTVKKVLDYISYRTESWQRFFKRNQISYRSHQEQVFDELVETAASRPLT
jgi:hypothetical protein